MKERPRTTKRLREELRVSELVEGFAVRHRAIFRTRGSYDAADDCAGKPPASTPVNEGSAPKVTDLESAHRPPTFNPAIPTT